MSMTSERAATRSADRIPKLRTRGRANRQRLLDVAQQLLKERRGEPLRFRVVFETAGVSRGSAYRIYDGIQDLLQDLASAWLFDFARFLRRNVKKRPRANWRQLSDDVIAASAEHWMATIDILIVLPRAPTYAQANYKEGVLDVTTTYADLFDRNFVMPRVADWLTVLSVCMQLCDTLFADAVRRDANITDERLLEAQKVCATYLSYHLPSELTPRVA